MGVCVCLSVCPTFKAYISLTMDRILIKLGENVGTLVLLIVLKFNFTIDCIKIQFATPHEFCATREAHNGSRGYNIFFYFLFFFFACLCVSEHFKSIETHFFLFFVNFRER